MGSKFNSQICTTREQSERLIALGVKEETADFPVWGTERLLYMAWSLHRLLMMLPSYVQIETYEYGRKYIAALDLELDSHLNVIYKEGVEEPCYDQYFYVNDAYESVCRAIEWLIKEGYFNKEYLV